MKNTLLLLILTALMSCSGSKKQTDVIVSEVSPVSEIEPLMMPSIPMAIIEPVERANYLSAHYWDNLVMTPVESEQDTIRLEQYFSNYLAVLAEAEQSTLTDNIHNSLTKIAQDSVYLSMLNYLSDKYLYDPNSPFRNDELYLIFVGLFKDNPRLSFADNERLKFKYGFLLKNRVGDKAQNFTIQTSEGATSLYKINADYLLLYFNNPGCHACAEVQSELMASDIISRLVSDGKLKVLSLYPDEDLEEWEKHRNDQPESWIKGYDSGMEIKKNQIYDLKAIPSLYLLDSQKRVILKDVTAAQIEDYLYNR